MAVPNIFAAATGSIPLSQLDTNFATPITLGNTTITLGNTATAINGLSLSNVTILYGTVSNVALSNLTSALDVASGGTGVTAPGGSGNVLTSNGSAWVSSVPSSSVLPSGAIMPFAMQTPPTGWLEANGSAISRTTYAALFSALGTLYGIGDGTTTFNLPDLRGYFVRGWDNSRGVDTGRVFGSAQTSAYTNHSHTATTSVTATDGGHNHTFDTIANSSGSFQVAGGVGGNFTTSANTGTAVANISASASTTVNASTTGSTETRPVNVAMLYCIKT